MDFQELLKAAQQNSSTTREKGKFYSTSFEPPKKVTKEKRLSDNIKKFLEQKKQEEEEERYKARQKKLELLAKRDPKLQRKLEKSLKVIKSSKKFYTGDKVLDENTAVTLGGSEQPDEDDYGFASNASDAIYKKLMEKYQTLPEDKKFANSKHRALTKEEIHNAKERMKTALATKEEEVHISHGHRPRTSKLKSVTDHGAGPSTSLTTDKKSSEKPKPKLKPAPIVDFQTLLKLAEQKQHEEIKIEVPAKKEPERLLTQREKREQEEMETARREKEARSKAGRIPKLGAVPRLGESLKQDKNNNDNKRPAQSGDRGKASTPSSNNKPEPKVFDKFKKPTAINGKSSSSNGTAASCGPKLRDALQKPIGSSKSSQPSAQSKSLPSSYKVPQAAGSSKYGNSSIMKSKDLQSKSVNGTKVASTTPQSIKSRPPLTTKEPPQKSREFPPKDLMRTREFPPKDLMRSREFPPRDLMRSREFPPKDTRRPSKMPVKRRIEDEDSEDEYDSELDDFIDDGEEDLDYSSEIKKIFGYDKNRYRDEDFDDSKMESDYRTVMKEEFISKKIGIMEDLEDMKREAEELKQKEMRMKMMKRRKL